MLTPFRFRELAGRTLVTGEAGDYGFFDDGVVGRFVDDNLTTDERRRFRELSLIIDDGDEWRLASLMRPAASSSRRLRARS